MSQLKITNAGATYKDEVFAGQEVQNITHFLFANIPGLLPTDPIDLDQPVPTANVVHSAPIGRVSRLNDNAVVMSATLGYDIGDFDYNWYGAVATKADGSEVLIAVVHTPLQTKNKTAGPVVGNYSVKSIVWRTSAIAQSLNISLSTLPWQVSDSTFVTIEDFNAALGNKLDKTAQAVDSLKLEGSSKAQVIASARSGLAADTHGHTAADVGADTSAQVQTKVNLAQAATQAKTINNKALSTNPVLVASDVGADTSDQVQAKIDTAIANILNAPPATLDTLNEIAAALGDDPNFATTMTNLIGAKGGLSANNTWSGFNAFKGATEVNKFGIRIGETAGVYQAGTTPTSDQWLAQSDVAGGAWKRGIGISNQLPAFWDGTNVNTLAQLQQAQTWSGANSFAQTITMADAGNESASIKFKLDALTDGATFRGTGGMWFGTGTGQNNDYKLLGILNDGTPAYYDGNYRALYHEGNKPSADDVGADTSTQVTAKVNNAKSATEAKTINGKAISTNPTLDANDVGATLPVTYLSKSGHNSQFALVDGRLYSAHGVGGSYLSSTSGRGVSGVCQVYGVDRGFKEIVIPNASPIVSVGVRHSFAWALLENGDLYTWGKNDYGQCGLGHTSKVATPTLAATGVTEVYDHPSIGGYSTPFGRMFIKKNDGYIYGAGYNFYGALGIGNTTNQSSFTKITALGTGVLSLWNMGSGFGCVFAQKADYTIHACGYGGQGNLGNNSTTVVNPNFVDVTAAWGGGAGYLINQVIGSLCYYDTSEFVRSSIGMLLDNGTTTVFRMTGRNNNSQLGDGTTTQKTVPVTPNVGAGRIKQVAFEGALGPVKVLKEDGALYGWGRTAEGTLGDGTTTTKSSPLIVATDIKELFSDGMNSHLYGFRTQSFIKNNANELLACGFNTDGMVGDGSITQKNSYVRVLLPFGFDVKMMGHFTTTGSGRVLLAVGVDNRIFAWGYNGNYGIHADNTANVLYPIQISLTAANK